MKLYWNRDVDMIYFPHYSFVFRLKLHQDNWFWIQTNWDPKNLVDKYGFEYIGKVEVL